MAQPSAGPACLPGDQPSGPGDTASGVPPGGSSSGWDRHVLRREEGLHRLLALGFLAWLPLLLGQPGRLETNLHQVHADPCQLCVGLGPGWAGQWGDMSPSGTSDLGSVDYGTLSNQPAFNNTPYSQLSCLDSQPTSS